MSSEKLKRMEKNLLELKALKPVHINKQIKNMEQIKNLGETINNLKEELEPYVVPKKPRDITLMRLESKAMEDQRKQLEQVAKLEETDQLLMDLAYTMPEFNPDFNNPTLNNELRLWREEHQQRNHRLTADDKAICYIGGIKRKSNKRKSNKRTSCKRKSCKRKSCRRKSCRRKSCKSKSCKRKSCKRKS